MSIEPARYEDEEYYEDGEPDDFDPNRCPGCGGDLLFGACNDPQCMWMPEDDFPDDLDDDFDNDNWDEERDE